ncbi:zinc-binding dehydrogenase [Cytobacillus spongiae]|jgi:NADPH2:quinone reductase|uniref:quinone oxidoreductase family protein n=1 Tax=Cytobacillus spongiae TaxID=2901381 RepID=UPI001F211663|nr:zinc-binding dehydrogenase [Cytobacillus spongiae]UII55820.1 zinc-binding dehydrogenase [Cytobacillus spongiae]
MKGIIVAEFGGVEHLKYVDLPVPIIEENEVLIKVRKTSVNFADIKSRYGKKGTKLPFIPGLDAAGIIEKVGANCTELSVGQRVIAFPKDGSYAEYVVAKKELVFPIPAELDFTSAAACPVVSFLSHRLLDQIARIQPGESILVHAAAGGVGSTSLQLAKMMGAGKIIGTVGAKEKIKVAEENGADDVICYKEGNFADKVNELTCGKGVDVILDSIAGNVTEESLKCLAPYGRLVQFGNSSGHIGHVKTVDLHTSCRSILGFSLGTTRKLRPLLLKETANEVIPMLANRELVIQIGEEFDLKEAAKAQSLVENRLSTGKVILHVSE